APGNAVGSSTGAGLDDPRLRERLDRYLASDAFLAEAFDRDLIRDLLESHFAGRQRHVYAVAMLLTVAEGSRPFTRAWVGAPPRGGPPQVAGAGRARPAGPALTPAVFSPRPDGAPTFRVEQCQRSNRQGTWWRARAACCRPAGCGACWSARPPSTASSTA